MLNFYGAIAAFVADLVVTVLVSLATKPKPVSELGGLGIVLVLSIIFA